MTANNSPPDSDVGARTLAAANLDRMHQVLDVAMKSGQSSLSAARANGVRASKLAVETTTKTIAYSQATAAARNEPLRSEESRVGHDCASPFSSRWSPLPIKHTHYLHSSLIYQIYYS